MKINVPRPRVAHQITEPVNRTPGIGVRGPGTRKASPAPAGEEAEQPQHPASNVRRTFKDWKPKP